MNIKKKYPNLLMVSYLEDCQKRKSGGQIKRLVIPASDTYIYWGEVHSKESTVTKEGSIKIDKETICAEFGCRKKLNLTEKLCGKYCVNHMHKQQEIFYNGNV